MPAWRRDVFPPTNWDIVLDRTEFHIDNLCVWIFCALTYLPLFLLLELPCLRRLYGCPVCPASPSGDRATTAQRRNLERANEVVKEKEILLSSADQPAEQNTSTCRLLPYI